MFKAYQTYPLKLMKPVLLAFALIMLSPVVGLIDQTVSLHFGAFEQASANSAQASLSGSSTYFSEPFKQFSR